MNPRLVIVKVSIKKTCDLITQHSFTKNSTKFLEIAFINVDILIKRVFGDRNQSVWYLDAPHAYQSLAPKTQGLSKKKIVKGYFMAGWKKKF